MKRWWTPIVHPMLLLLLLIVRMIKVIVCHVRWTSTYSSNSSTVMRQWHCIKIIAQRSNTTEGGQQRKADDDVTIQVVLRMRITMRRCISQRRTDQRMALINAAATAAAVKTV